MRVRGKPLLAILATSFNKKINNINIQNAVKVFRFLLASVASRLKPNEYEGLGQPDLLFLAGMAG